MLNRWQIISLIVVSFLLAGFPGLSLASEPKHVITVIPPSDNEQKQKVYTYLLDEQGIDVLKLGETRTLIISSDQLFVPGSANFKQEYVNNLKVIAQLINSYQTVNIAISAYSDQRGERGQALTDKQAQKVLAYLKAHGLDTRLVYAKGYGHQYPVATTQGKNHFNRRIEIKFQFYKDGGA